MPFLQSNSYISDLFVLVPEGHEKPLASSSLPVSTIPNTNSIAKYGFIRKRIRQFSPDVVFIPTAQWLNLDQIPITVMIRNMEPLVTPFQGNPFREKLINLVRALFAFRAAKRANRVIAVSQYVHDFITARWSIPPQKIRIIPHGISLPSLADASMPQVYLDRMKSQFIFTAGSVRPARGLEDIIYASALLRHDMSDFTVAIAGAVEPHMQSYKSSLDRLIARLNLNSNIVWLGPLSSMEMSWCYFHCSCFVMTSRVEACPNIALEAMAHGCATISTSLPPMPEFFKDAAFYYSPGDTNNLAKAIKYVFRLDKVNIDKIELTARSNASDYSWQNCADRTAEELFKVTRRQKASEGM